VKLLSTLGLLLLAAADSALAAGHVKHILHIVADDIGWNDLLTNVDLLRQPRGEMRSNVGGGAWVGDWI